MDELQYLDGLYVGQLSERERRLFELAVSRGEARRTYDDMMGFLGCAKVRVIPTCDMCGEPRDGRDHSGCTEAYAEIVGHGCYP